MSSTEVTDNEWVKKTTVSIRREENEKRLRLENAALKDGLIQQNARPLWDCLVTSMERAVKDFNEQFSDEPKRRFYFSLNDPDSITVANEFSGLPRLEARFDDQRQMLHYTRSWSDRPSHTNGFVHIGVRHGIVSWMLIGNHMSTEETTKLLLERVFQPGPVLDW